MKLNVFDPSIAMTWLNILSILMEHRIVTGEKATDSIRQIQYGKVCFWMICSNNKISLWLDDKSPSQLGSNFLNTLVHHLHTIANNYLEETIYKLHKVVWHLFFRTTWSLFDRDKALGHNIAVNKYSWELQINNNFQYIEWVVSSWEERIVRASSIFKTIKTPSSA